MKEGGEEVDKSKVLLEMKQQWSKKSVNVTNKQQEEPKEIVVDLDNVCFSLPFLFFFVFLL